MSFSEVFSNSSYNKEIESRFAQVDFRLRKQIPSGKFIIEAK